MPAKLYACPAGVVFHARLLHEASDQEVVAALHPSLRAMVTIPQQKARTPPGVADDALHTALVAAVENWVRAGFPILDRPFARAGFPILKSPTGGG
jgi:hypothetical protein